ncbi:hypothetical protein IMSAG185_00464 [Lachnospiraceae bacterium]|jgi:hypothetical protein|nr:hypothetical protein IMSAG185_00464 [Lachnospiraceae bacterium]
MNNINFSKKFIYISCILIVFLICAAGYLGIARRSTPPTISNTAEQGNAKEMDTAEQWNRKEIEVAQALYDFDKTIKHVFVNIEASDNEILSANIFVVSEEMITEAVEQDVIKSIASGLLNLDTQDISILYTDSESFTEQGR